jgi:hypothetical protein
MHGKNTQLSEELELELRHLRALVREVGEHFILRHEGAIETIISNLGCVPSGRLKAGIPEWLQHIRGLRLKPAKGRLKDMKDIVAVIEALTEQVICAQEGRTTVSSKKRGE